MPFEAVVLNAMQVSLKPGNPGDLGAFKVELKLLTDFLVSVPKVSYNP